MRRERRGLVFLINNEQFYELQRRDGTRFDRDYLKSLFIDLHFEVEVENDLTAKVELFIFYFFFSRGCIQILIQILITN